MVQVGNNLTELVKAFVAAEPNRARGGIVALTGFEYQIWSYLADFALALSANDLIEGGRQFAHAFETLSDYTRESETGTVCVQVKHHLDTRALSLAGAEFAAIERFFESHATFDLRDRVTYEVVARTGATSLDWATIQLPHDVTVREPDLSGYFGSLRDGGRLLAPRFEPDPHWKLIAAVYTQLADPFGFARRAFELCMRRTREPASAAFVRGMIAEDYAANLQKRPHASRPLSASDFNRDPNGSGISLARTPTLRDLRFGRFMERSKRVVDLLAVLDDIQNSNRGLTESAIPVLWIDGRSGCGKSVLLLQVMERLVVDSHAAVVWFANGTEEVGTIVAQMAESDACLRPDFLVVDDIYDPQARDDLDLPRLTRLIVHSGLTTWPILITCGPTEFRQDFERDCRAEGFRVTPWHLSTLEQAETSALRTWFQSRTGRLPEPGSASTEQRALMLSVIFELEHGDLRPFASRFRNRLVQDQLDSVLSVPLALNRLYIWTPRRWLSSDEEARLERLNQDGDFSVLSVEGRGNDLFKLTHPHLSDAIYRALHPEAIPTTFARHLVTAFSRALSSHPPSAVRLLRTAASNPARLEIIDEEELAAGMTAAWNVWDKSGLDQGTATAMWIDWAKWAARQPAVAASLSASPLATAIEMLDSEHPRWPLLWSLLWGCAPGEPALVNRALEWLPSHFKVDGWYLVWWRVAVQSMQYAREMNAATETTDALCRVGSDWLNVSSNLFGWSRVWQQLVDARDLMSATSHDEVIRAGLAWVREYHQARAWNFVWEKLASLSQKEGSDVASDEIYGLGLNWLNDYPNHPGWPFVWQHFIARRSLPVSIARTELLQLGVRWSSGRENDPSWIFVALKLASEGNYEAKRKGFEGLAARIEQHPDLPRWHANWYRLFETRKNDLTSDQRRRLFIAGCEWVAADDEREYVPFVLTQLVRNLNAFLDVADENGLINRACDVLSRTVETDEREWAQLRFAVVQHVRAWPSARSSKLLDTLIVLGRRWVGMPEHLSDGTWSQVYRVVYRIGTDDEGTHRSLAIKGILQGLILDSASFASFLYSNPAGEAPPDEVINWLEQWFSGPARESGGFSIWMRLDRATREALAQRSDSRWMKLRNVLDIHRPDQVVRWEKVIQHYHRRQPVVGRVMKRLRGAGRKRRHGYLVDIGVNAYLPLEEAAINSGSESARMAVVGQVLEFDILRLDKTRLHVDVSRRTLLRRRQQELLAASSKGTNVEDPEGN